MARRHAPLPFLRAARTLDLLKLPPATGPQKWWVTEFEDPWPYRTAPADLYFARAARQDAVKRPPIVEYTAAEQPDVGWVLAGVVFVPTIARRLRRRPGA